MNCRDFEIRLEALLDARLDTGTHQSCLDHARVCTACYELLAAVGGPSPQSRAEVPRHLTTYVLEKTIGSACGQARHHLPAHVDRELDSVDRELLDAHLEGCTDCQRLRATLMSMRRELPRLAEVPLDERFTTEVMAATLTGPARTRRWWQSHWSRWVQRPRFAMEAAYVGVLVVMLVLGAFSTPLEALPQKGLQMVQTDPESPSIWTQTGKGLGTFWEWYASVFEEAEEEPKPTEE